MPRSSQGDAAVELTRELVRIDSVSPSLVPGAPGEAEIAPMLAGRLAAAGFSVELIEDETQHRPSVLAVRDGSSPGRTVALNGHLDTVGVEGMPDPFGAQDDGIRMRGRGTSDMKGGVAGLIVAAERLAAQDAAGRLVIALVADEEDGSVGATTILEVLRERDLVPDVCLIAEPTWLDVAVAHRGYQVISVTMTGRAGHSSQPESAVDVMPSLGALLVAVAGHDAGLRASAPHPMLAHGSLMATVASAGVAPFTTAANANVIVERRTLPGEPADIGVRELQTLVAGLAAPPGLEISVEPTISRAAWQADTTGPAAELTSALQTALPTAGAAAPALTGAPYWMESALWQEAGIPAVVCGPAGGGLHSIDEWVDLRQVRAFSAAVESAVGGFLAGRSTA